MDESLSQLQLAIEHDDVDKLYRLFEGYEKLLDHESEGPSEGPFPNTPLHDAADKGSTKVAMEIAILKPSFAQKLNRGGHSPMHLALQKKHYHTARALMTFNPELIRVRGRGGITPLHFVAGEIGNDEQENVVLLELLAEFLSACKSSIEDLTNQYETAVHVSIKRGNTKAFKVLFGWLKRVYLTEILNWKDEDGNTVLHIAVSEWQPEIIKLLIGHINYLDKMTLFNAKNSQDKMALLNAKNFQDKTALDIFQENSSGDQNLAKKLRPPTLKVSSLSQFLSRKLSCHEWFVFNFGHEDERAHDMVLLVATLITTATYQAALSPPGGYWGDNSSNTPANSTVVAANSSGIAVEKPHQAGNIILSGSNLHQFTAFNSLVFLASIITVWITAIPLLPHTIPVYLLTYLVGAAYFVTLGIEFPKSDQLAGYIIMGICLNLLGVVLVVPWILWLKYYRLRCRLDATGRRVGNFPESKDRK